MQVFESGVLDLPHFYFTGDDYRYRFDIEAKTRFINLVRETHLPLSQGEAEKQVSQRLLFIISEEMPQEVSRSEYTGRHWIDCP